MLGRQLLRSGTSIGANVEEAQAAQSRADFVSKLHIALKEARECHYWLRLIRDSGLAPHDVTPLLARSEQLIGLLTTIIRTTRSNPNP